LIVKRVIEGISDEESLKRKDLFNKQVVNSDKNPDVAHTTDANSSAVSLNAGSADNLIEIAKVTDSSTKDEDQIVFENPGNETSITPKEEVADSKCMQPMKEKGEGNTTLTLADESKNSSNTDLQDMPDESEISNTPNLEPIPIEKEEDRAIICPVVDGTELNNNSQQQPLLVKAKSGAMVVKYPEQTTAKEEEINDLINEEMKAMTEDANDVTDVKDNDTPRITVTEASDVSRGSDESTSESKNKKDTNKDLVNKTESDVQNGVHEQVYEGGNKTETTTEGKDMNEEDTANMNGTVSQNGANEQIIEDGNKTVQPSENESKKTEEITAKTTEEITTKSKQSERPDSAVSLSSSSESSETDVKFFVNGEEVKYPREIQNGTPADGTPNLLEIDGKIIDLDNLESLDKETYKKVMAVAYNIDVMSTISEEHSTSQSTAHISNK
jgi:hypothetical protein